MAVEIDMTKDLKEYEPRVIGVFSLRQVIAVGVNAIIATPIAIITPLTITYKIFLFAILMLPAIFCGWLPIENMHFEDFLIEVIRASFKSPTRRFYENKSEIIPEKKQKIKKSKEFTPKK